MGVYDIARVLQGEAGGNVAGLRAVASTIYNRAARSGADPTSVALAPGQFIGRAEPGAAATTIAQSLIDGTFSPTTNATNFVSRVPGASWGGVAGATGPATAGIISGGTNIGGNFFSDRWGAPSANFQVTGGTAPSAPLSATNPGTIGTPGAQEAAKGGFPLLTQSDPAGASILTGLWETMGVTATTTAGKTEADAIKAAGQAQAEATGKQTEQIKGSTTSLTKTLTGLGSTFFGNTFDLFVRGGVLVVGLVALGIAGYVLASGGGKDAFA